MRALRHPALRWAIALECALWACSVPAPLPPATGDACVDACARRAALGCIEPWAVATCPQTCRDAKAIGYDPAPVASARSVSEMPSWVRCGR